MDSHWRVLQAWQNVAATSKIIRNPHIHLTCVTYSLWGCSIHQRFRHSFTWKFFIGGRNPPAALQAHNIVTSVPRSALVSLPTLRFSFSVITLWGGWTVLRPVSSMFQMFPGGGGGSRVLVRECDKAQRTFPSVAY